MRILICNAGSTSLKFKLYDYPGASVLAEGKEERIGSKDYSSYSFKTVSGISIREERAYPMNYDDGIRRFLSDLKKSTADGRIDAVGFKATIAKGFPGVHVIDDKVIKGMEDMLPIAPVHNRVYLDAIMAFRRIMPDASLVAAFETAFHRSLPDERRIYSVPYEWYEKYGVQRMGYHGASHEYVSEQLRQYRRVISCHLGGSGSVCAILDGKSIDTSFGFSLQAGLTHVNRAGDIDSYIIPFMVSRGMSLEEVIRGLDKDGGLAGISGLSGDMRDLRAASKAGNERARLAIRIYANDVKRYIGAFTAELGGIDALSFTAGIGENDADIRSDICSNLDYLGIMLDPDKNKNNDIRIESGAIPVYVIHTDEEAIVSRKVYECLTEN